MKVMPPPHGLSTEGTSSSLLPLREYRDGDDDEEDDEGKHNYDSDISDPALPATESANPTHSHTYISSTTLKNIRVGLHVSQEICLLILLPTWLWFKSYFRSHHIPVPTTISTILTPTFLTLLTQGLTTIPGSRLRLFSLGTAHGSTWHSPPQQRRRFFLLLVLPFLLSIILLLCWSFALVDLVRVAGWMVPTSLSLQQQGQRGGGEGVSGDGGGVCEIVSWDEDAAAWVAHGIYDVSVCRTYVMEVVFVGLEVVATGAQMVAGVWNWWRGGEEGG